MSTPTTAAPAASETAAPEAAIESQESPQDETAADASGAIPDADSSKLSGINAAKKEAAPKEEKKSNKKTLKLKVDGQEFDEEIDLDNEEELIRNLQFSKAAQKRMQEKATLEKEISAFFDLLQKNPEKAMKEIGLDPEDFAVKTLQRKIDEEQKSPEQRAKEKLEQELQELRDKIKADDDARQQSELQRHQVEQEKKIEEGMIAALDSSGLPNKPLVVKKLAEIMLVALDNGLDLSPQDVAPIAKRELEEDMKEYIAALPDEALDAFLGKERLVNLRKKQVAAIKKAADTANSVKQTGNNPTKEAAEKKANSKKISMSSFLRS